jgi:hypothetical protein
MSIPGEGEPVAVADGDDALVRGRAAERPGRTLGGWVGDVALFFNRGARI